MSGQADPKDDAETVVSARIRRSQAERLRAVAESEHRTLSGELRRIIEARLSDAEEAA